MIRQARPCACNNTRDNLAPIPVGGPLTRYGVCRTCLSVWVDRYSAPDGRPESTLRLEMEDPRVPEAVRERVRALLGDTQRPGRARERYN